MSEENKLREAVYMIIRESSYEPAPVVYQQVDDFLDAVTAALPELYDDTDSTLPLDDIEQAYNIAIKDVTAILQDARTPSINTKTPDATWTTKAQS